MGPPPGPVGLSRGRRALPATPAAPPIPSRFLEPALVPLPRARLFTNPRRTAIIRRVVGVLPLWQSGRTQDHPRAVSSGGERFVDTEEVTGSNPVLPIFPRGTAAIRA